MVACGSSTPEGEFKANLGYIVRPYLKKLKKKKQQNPQKIKKEGPNHTIIAIR
jgi:hypothetical protein